MWKVHQPPLLVARCQCDASALRCAFRFMDRAAAPPLVWTYVCEKKCLCSRLSGAGRCLFVLDQMTLFALTVRFTVVHGAVDAHAANAAAWGSPLFLHAQNLSMPRSCYPCCSVCSCVCACGMWRLESPYLTLYCSGAVPAMVYLIDSRTWHISRCCAATDTFGLLTLTVRTSGDTQDHDE